MDILNLYVEYTVFNVFVLNKKIHKNIYIFLTFSPESRFLSLFPHLNT